MSQVQTNVVAWVAGGYNQTDVTSFLHAYEQAAGDANAFLEPRMPHASEVRSGHVVAGRGYCLICVWTPLAWPARPHTPCMHALSLGPWILRSIQYSLPPPDFHSSVPSSTWFSFISHCHPSSVISHHQSHQSPSVIISHHQSSSVTISHRQSPVISHQGRMPCAFHDLPHTKMPVYMTQLTQAGLYSWLT